MPFAHDPKDSLHFICIDCEEAIQELRDDYEYEDDEDMKGD
jgi:hypothetical protein